VRLFYAFVLRSLSRTCDIKENDMNRVDKEATMASCTYDPYTHKNAMTFSLEYYLSSPCPIIPEYELRVNNSNFNSQPPLPTPEIMYPCFTLPLRRDPECQYCQLSLEQRQAHLREYDCLRQMHQKALRCQCLFEARIEPYTELDNPIGFVLDREIVDRYLREPWVVRVVRILETTAAFEAPRDVPHCTGTRDGSRETHAHARAHPNVHLPSYVLLRRGA
jgi:hypothetical protein